MSNYFYTLDALRQFVEAAHDRQQQSASNEAVDGAAATSTLSKLHLTWPTPTLKELSEALPLFCDQGWHSILEHHDATPHAYTQPHMLPHRCLEAVYMVTLLRDGFGYEPQERDITIALHVNDSEVVWT